MASTCVRLWAPRYVFLPTVRKLHILIAPSSSSPSFYFQCIILAVRTLHVLIRYGMFLYDMRQGAISNDSVSWDKRGSIAYYTEFGFDLAALLVDLAHHLHMLLWSNIFLSMASLVIIMQLRYLANEIQRKFKKHRNYLWVLKHMEKNYQLATNDDLQINSDNCAICWEKMLTARKLPCSHLFHESCLQR
jgi:autocrine motility factor receptor